MKFFLNFSQNIPAATISHSLNFYWQDERFESETNFCGMEKTIEDIRSISMAHFDVLFIFANASIPEFAFIETQKKLKTFQNKIRTELGDLLDRHISTDQSKWLHTESCKTFFSEMQKKRMETIIALFSMGLFAPLFNDDDTEEISDANAAQFEKTINDALQPFLTVENPIKLSIVIGSCKDVKCLADKIQVFASADVKSIVSEKMNGGAINQRLRRLLLMIFWLVSKNTRLNWNHNLILFIFGRKR